MLKSLGADSDGFACQRHGLTGCVMVNKYCKGDHFILLPCIFAYFEHRSDDFRIW
jgi:hypothetical protein